MADKNWSDYLDESGLVVQKKSMGGDGGDSLQRSMSMHILCYLQGKPAPGSLLHQKLAQFSCSKGKFRRHPDNEKWYSKCNTTSRDQLTPLVIMLGLVQFGLMGVFRDHLKRALLFTYNTRHNFQYPTEEETNAKNPPDSGVVWNYGWKLPDVTGPEFWALYIRGFNQRLLYPVLALLDAHTLIGAIVLRFKRSEDDVINHSLVLEYGKVRMQTPFMWLARKITPRGLLQERLDQFFGKEIEPPINELYRSLE